VIGGGGGICSELVVGGGGGVRFEWEIVNSREEIFASFEGE
jgi:hypothetical protein